MAQRRGRGRDEGRLRVARGGEALDGGHHAEAGARNTNPCVWGGVERCKLGASTAPGPAPVNGERLWGRSIRDPERVAGSRFVDGLKVADVAELAGVGRGRCGAVIKRRRARGLPQTSGAMCSERISERF